MNRVNQQNTTTNRVRERVKQYRYGMKTQKTILTQCLVNPTRVRKTLRKLIFTLECELLRIVIDLF